MNPLSSHNVVLLTTDSIRTCDSLSGSVSRALWYRLLAPPAFWNTLLLQQNGLNKHWAPAMSSQLL